MFVGFAETIKTYICFVLPGYSKPVVLGVHLGPSVTLVIEWVVVSSSRPMRERRDLSQTRLYKCSLLEMAKR